MYAERITNSMHSAMEETQRRRKIQEAYNREHGIVPQSIQKSVQGGLYDASENDDYAGSVAAEAEEAYVPKEEIPGLIQSLQKEMREASQKLEFERAAELRDRIKALGDAEIGLKTGKE